MQGSSCSRVEFHVLREVERLERELSEIGFIRHELNRKEIV